MKPDYQSACPATGKLFHGQAIFGASFTFLTSGVFLSGLAMYMGASDLLVSYISMVVNICGISILFFSSFIGRLRSLKKAALCLTGLSKLATLLLVLIPLLAPPAAQIAVFIPLMVCAFTLQAQTTVVLNNWLVAFVDEKQSGRYIARRQTFVLGVTVVLSLAGGWLLDAVSGAYVGFLLLFLAASLMGLGEILLLLRIPDAEQQAQPAQRPKLRHILRVPVACRPFFRFVVYIFLFYLALSLADSFTVVYMMRYLKLGYVATTALQMLISLPQIFLLGLWGRISDKRGHRFTLWASIWFFTGETLFMALSNSQNLYIMIPIAFLFAAVANAGFAVSVFNRRYELMPREDRIVYDSFYSAAVGLAFIAGPLLGGAVKQLLERSRWVQDSIPLGNIRLLYAAATAAIVLLQVFSGDRRHKKNVREGALCKK